MSGTGRIPSLRSDEIVGLQMADPVQLDWTGKRSTRQTISVQTGDWPSGLYAARLETPDGRIGFAPFVLRPTTPGGGRVAVVLPTNTWQAYNLYDADGDGWGDTWYAGGTPPVVLDRPYRDRGVPPRFRRYDFPFVRWLEKLRREPDFYTDDDLDTFATGDDLRRLYDLVVFPGHTEYVTTHAYDVVERYRDLGGRLVFLSANNFFWKVERRGPEIRRIAQWRTLGRPEARLLGVQYRANDDGQRQAPFIVTDRDATPWLFEGTGLENGDLLGEEVGGFGIEIDMTTPLSPPGTQVPALIPNLFGVGLNAEMAYYETPAGARVFSAGVLDFPAIVLYPAGMRMLDNLWRHMLEDLPRTAPAPGRRRSRPSTVAPRREAVSGFSQTVAPSSTLRDGLDVPLGAERDDRERDRREQLAGRHEEEHLARAPRLEQRAGDDHADGPGEHGGREHGGHHLRAQRLRRAHRDHADQRRVHERPEERRRRKRGHHGRHRQVEREREDRQRQGDEGRRAQPQRVVPADDANRGDAPEHGAAHRTRRRRRRPPWSSSYSS